VVIQKLASGVGSLTCGALANVVENTFDETCCDPKKQMQSLMARFEYRGDASGFTLLGSIDTPLLDTNNQPKTSGTTNDPSFIVPLVNGCSLVSGRGASLLPDVVTIEAQTLSTLAQTLS
jgi:hypothetical protein